MINVYYDYLFEQELQQHIKLNKNKKIVKKKQIIKDRAKSTNINDKK